MELQDYFRIWRKHWVVIVVFTLLVTALSAAWTATRTPQYQADTRLFVSVRANENTVGELQQGSTYARQIVTSYVEVVGTSIIMDLVAEKVDTELTSEEISLEVKANTPADSVLIDISATDPDPKLAAEIANVTASVFSDIVVNRLERTEAGSPARVQMDIVQPAQVPLSPVSPKVIQNLVIGIFLGLILGLTAAVVREVLDIHVNTKNDVAGVTNTPVLGRVMRDPNATQKPLIVQDDPRGHRAEAFRHLRTNLQFLRIEGNPHSFVVSSPGPSEGKTTTVANLAIALAEAGSSVCLVDGDLRKPRIAEIFGIEGGVGLSDVIIGRVALNNAVQEWGKGHLAILPAGRRSPNPSELLGSVEMKAIISQLTETFDYVLVDAPPAVVVTDAALIAKSVSGALMVAASGKTRKTALEAALNNFDTINARVLGVILTMVPEKGPDSYGYESYQYYGEEHSAPSSKWKILHESQNKSDVSPKSVHNGITSEK